jgi:hypothetical protein
MIDIRYISVPLVEHTHFLFVNKCKYNDISTQEVLLFAIEKFIDGDYDKEFGILKDDPEPTDPK